MENFKQFKTPGQLIEALLQERGWTQALLSAILGKDTTTINKLVSDKSGVSAEFAVLLEEAFSVPAENFLELQKSFDLAKARYTLTPDPKRANRAKLLSELPINEMVSRGWISVSSTKNIAETVAAIGNFFGADKTLDAELISYAARKTNAHEAISPLQLAWLYRVVAIAQQMVVTRPFVKSKAKDLIAQLKSLLIAPQEARKVPKLFAEFGIRLVFVEALKNSKIDGVCTWLNENSPVIGLSLRFDRLDNFWFVLRHELEHVIQGHGLLAPHLDVEMEADANSVIDAQEAQANEAAAHFSIPKGKLDSFIARKAPIFQERDFLGFASLLGIHPSIAAGQIRHKTKRYELFNAHNAKIRDHVLPTAISDGWGTIAPF